MRPGRGSNNGRVVFGMEQCFFSLWLSTEVVAFSPRPHPYLPCLLPCLVRDSLCTALQTKILWINWSLNAIDTIETWFPYQSVTLDVTSEDRRIGISLRETYPLRV